MKRIPYLFLLISSISIYSQKSNTQILEKTITELNRIETVFFTSIYEGIESEITFIHSEDEIFFDFSDKIPNSIPKYYIKNRDSELIYDGKKHIQSLVKEKLIVTGGSRNPNNPLMLTLYQIKEFLPKLLSKTNIKITRKKDTVINNVENYAFELIYKGGFLHFEKLILKDVPGANGENIYQLMINKSNYLPSKFIAPNGPTATMSRTFNNFNFNYEVDNNLWTGKLLPSDYEIITFNVYGQRMQVKMRKKSTKDLNDVGIGNIGNWNIPNLESNELVDFSKFKGNVVLLEFWFKYCGPCVRAVPKLNKMHLKYKDDKFLLYGIEFMQNFPRENLQDYVSKIRMNYPVLFKGKDLAIAHGVQAAPTFMIIDKKGNIIYLEAGFDQANIEKIIEDNL